MYIGTSSQFKDYDHYLLNKENKSINELIFEASKILFTFAFNEKKAIIFAGKGNNGADGLALSCLMKKNEQDVCVIFLGDIDNIKEGTKYYLSNAIKVGVEVYPVKEIDETIHNIIVDKLSSANLVIDAIFGFGFTGALTGIEEECVNIINQEYQGKVLSIDVPSGMDVDSGNVINDAVKADMTVSFVANKLGFLNPSAKTYLGELVIEALPYDPAILDIVKMAKSFGQKEAVSLIHERDYYEHKYIRGKTLHMTGCNNYKGASVLAAKGALYSGVGLVNVCSNYKVLSNINASLPEVITIEDDKVNLSKTINDYKSVLFGSGIGNVKDNLQRLEEVITLNQGTTIIDGDGISTLSKNLHMLDNKKGSVIITPHLGEFKRLVTNMNDPTTSAIDFAKEHNVIIVLKGPNTLVTDGNRVFRNLTGNPSMATAGMGDVLAGLISGLVAQGYTSINASLLAVYIHGEVGDQLAKQSYSVFASELASYIPMIMKELVDKKKS